MWWKIASLDRKVKMKALVDNGQLEMVTAGWVMTDEANTHYFAMIDQMIEGNLPLMLFDGIFYFCEKCDKWFKFLFSTGYGLLVITVAFELSLSLIKKASITVNP